MNHLKCTVLAAALTLSHAGAAAADENGFYAGIGLGQSSIESDDFEIDSFSRDENLDDDTDGFKVFGGYQLNKFFSVELAYIDGGEQSTTTENFLSFRDVVFIVDAKNEVETTQVNASAVGTFAFNDYFGVMGRLGVSFIDAEARRTVRSPGAPRMFPIEADDDATELAYGVGLWVAPTKNFRLRLEYEMTSAELFDELIGKDVDLSLISLSAVYRFGQ